MQVIADWQKLMDNEVPSEQAKPLVASAVAALEQVLKDRPEVPTDVLALLNKEISIGVDAKTWERVGTTLARYLGGEQAAFTQWIVAESQLDRLSLVEADASTSLIGFLRSILGHYGSELQTAYGLSVAFGNDWLHIEREILVDNVTGASRIRHRITKWNGEEVFLECAPRSFANLVVFIMGTLPKLTTPKVLSAENVSGLVDQAHEIIRFVTPPAGEAKGKAGAVQP